LINRTEKIWPKNLSFTKYYLGDNNLNISEKFPQNFKQLVNDYLEKKFGETVSIRSTIIHPPTKGGVQENNGKEVVFYTGKVQFNVLDRSSKDFGFHRMSYVIRDNQIISMEEIHDNV
jgi:hypothetical protein